MSNIPNNLGVKLALISLASSGVIFPQQYEEETVIPSTIPDYTDLNLSTNDWDMELPNLSNSVEFNDFVEYSVIQNFTEQIVENSIDIDKDILETTEEIFWDIL